MRWEVVVLSIEHHGLYVAYSGPDENVAVHLANMCGHTIRATGGTGTVRIREGVKITSETHYKEGVAA